MQKAILFFLLLIVSLGNAQGTPSKTKRIESLIQIWGLLKYKHPIISKGKINFDKEFIVNYNKLKTLNSESEINDFFINWINSFSQEKLKSLSNLEQNRFTKNEDYSWIKNSFFNTKLSQMLLNLKQNSNYSNFYAKVNTLSSTIDFKNDTSLTNFDINNESHRILFLASFWNKMRYWNVNIYLTEIPWNTVLKNSIPQFLDNKKIDFSSAKDALFSHINDSHADYQKSPIFDTSTIKFSNYGGRIVNDTLVITFIRNKEIAKKDNIELGDMIVAVDDENLKEYYHRKFSNRISVSNENYLKYRIERFFLLSDTAEKLKIDLVKTDGKEITKFIKLKPLAQSINKPQYLTDTLIFKKWTSLTSSVGYINLRTTNKDDLRKAFKAFKNTKGIVIDLRNYPKNLKVSDLPYFLYPEKKLYLKVLTSQAPAIGKYDTQAMLKIIKNPFVVGRKNKNHYQGKIILLVDRSTISMAEYFGMAIQASPNCITIGEQTSGAVMNRNEITLKDNTKIDYTSVGAFYPDNTHVQRKGLKLDYTVKESAKKYTNYKYIEEALKLLEKLD